MPGAWKTTGPKTLEEKVAGMSEEYQIDWSKKNPEHDSGGKVFFIGNALVDLFLQSRNWPFGSAVAVTLVIIMLVTVTLYMRFAMGGKSGRDDSIM